MRPRPAHDPNDLVALVVRFLAGGAFLAGAFFAGATRLTGVLFGSEPAVVRPPERVVTPIS